MLWERLGEAARVTVVSAPPGSGKTVLLRSWISAAGLAEYAAWVPVGRDEGDPQRLWLAMLDAPLGVGPEPDYIGKDLNEIADQLIYKYGSGAGQ